MSEAGDRDRRALLLVALGAVCISTAAVWVKLATQTGLGPSAVGAWRCLLGASLLFPLTAASGLPLRPPRRVLAFALLAGVFFAADLFVWHRAIGLIGAGLATILANTQVFWTTALVALLFGARVRPAFVGATLLAFAGVVALVGVGSDRPSGHLLGVALGLATGLAYAGYVLALREAGRVAPSAEPSAGRVAPSAEPSAGSVASSLRLLAWASLVAGGLLTASSRVEGAALWPSGATAWISVGGLAVVPQVLGWLAIARGLPHVPAERAGLVLLVQPILATVWGVILFDETLGPLQAVGALVTLGAIYLGSRAKPA